MLTATVDDFYDDPTLAGADDPYSVYAQVRAMAPAHWCPGPQMWVLVSYDAVAHSLRDPALNRGLERDQLAAIYGNSEIYETQKMDLPYMDGESHRAMRRHIIKAYHAIDFESLSAYLRRFLDDRLRRVDQEDSFDLTAVVANDLSAYMVSELIGVPPEQQEEAARVVAPFVAARGLTQSAETAHSADEAVDVFESIFLPLIHERRANPTGDLASRLIADPAEGIHLTDEQMLVMISSNFYAASTFTLRLFIGTLAMAMATHQDIYQRVRADRSLIPVCVDEVLRWDPPAQANNSAIATADHRYGDVVFPAGAAVTAMVGAANRDPAQFVDPDLLRLDRDPHRNLTFAPGVHQCLGTHQAHLAVGVTLDAMADHLPKFGYDAAASRRFVGDRFRGFDRLVVHRG